MTAILKFVLIAAVILIVWFVFRTRGRINIVDTAIKAAKKVAQDHTENHAEKSAPPAKIEDLVKCPKCGSYNPKGRPCSCESA